ncbi:nucleotidyltransferase domain-containing protein [Roseateles sp. L2-2]|uniref:nucleotidyltransferase domain-containing protein n=1 Tax=Roseateles sp. L2-2 TaxID=3422597 RepID=UPI003D36C282
MSAADFLFTPTVQRVLGITLTAPDRVFTLAELLREAGSGRGSTQLQIERLLVAGVLVEGPRQGRQRSIRANTEFFLFPELSSIALKTFGLARPIEEALAPFADRIEEAFVFGSVAKELDTGRSDIDVMVIGDVTHLELIEAADKLQSRLQRSLQFVLYDPVEWRDLVESDPVIRQIVGGPRLQVVTHATTGGVRESDSKAGP